MEVSTDNVSMEEFLAARIQEWENSDVLKWMKIGAKYHNGENDIKNRTRFLIGRNGEQVTPKFLAQSKIAHNFIRKLTRQKVGYLLSQPFTATTESDELKKVLKEKFNDEFFRILKNIGQDSINEGIAWGQVFYDEDGELSIKRIPATEVIPFWKDIDHIRLESLIRVYSTTEYSGKDKKEVKRVKYFDEDGIWNFVYMEDGLKPDPDVPWEPHFVITNGDVDPETGQAIGEGVVWDILPMIPFKYNSEEIPLIYFIKDIIDDYDLNTSDLSNELQDEPNSPKVVRNYDGTDKGEFVHNLATLNTMFVRDDGDIKMLSNVIDHSARDSHLDRLRKDLYEIGGGVDTQTKHLGDASGVALKFVYSDLDMDCDEFANELRYSLRLLIWFIVEDIRIRSQSDLHDQLVKIEFNTNTNINEEEKITNLKNSSGMISHETILDQHPYVQDVEAEKKRIEEESRKTLGDLMDQGKEGV
jgi:SPP1 family phage portal protein